MAKIAQKIVLDSGIDYAKLLDLLIRIEMVL
mgnify:CR=1 FL=1